MPNMKMGIKRQIRYYSVVSETKEVSKNRLEMQKSEENMIELWRTIF